MSPNDCSLTCNFPAHSNIYFLASHLGVFLSYVFLFVFGKWRDVLNANGLRRIDYGRAGVELHTIL